MIVNECMTVNAITPTWRMAASTAADDGDAKTSPHTAAVSIPGPT